jgi:hypothetical protein
LKNFALIAAAEYIVPIDLKVIKETSNNLIVEFDKFDIVIFSIAHIEF